MLTLYSSSTSALLMRLVSGCWLLLLWLLGPHGLLLLAGPLWQQNSRAHHTDGSAAQYSRPSRHSGMPEVVWQCELRECARIC